MNEARRQSGRNAIEGDNIDNIDRYIASVRNEERQKNHFLVYLWKILVL